MTGDVPCRILVVEDDERMRSSLRLVLEDEGHLVAEAASGEEAGVGEPLSGGLALVEVVLLGMDGLQLSVATAPPVICPCSC